MKRVVISIGTLLLALGLCGLSTRYAIKVVKQGSTTTSFQFEPSGGSDATVKANTFLVVKRDASGQWNYKNPMWEIQLSPGRSKPISQIEYGRVPDGFKETTKAIPLDKSTHYLAVGLTPGSGGSIEFEN